MWKTPHGMANYDATGKVGGAGGGEFAKQANQWPTPKDRDWKGQSQRGKHGLMDALPNMACRSSLPAPQTSMPGGKSSTRTRRLNPRFVEWLMGLPAGWTDFAPVEMRLWLSRLRMRLRHLLDGSG